MKGSHQSDQDHPSELQNWSLTADMVDYLFQWLRYRGRCRFLAHLNPKVPKSLLSVRIEMSVSQSPSGRCMGLERSWLERSKHPFQSLWRSSSALLHRQLLGSSSCLN